MWTCPGWPACPELGLGKGCDRHLNNGNIARSPVGRDRLTVFLGARKMNPANRRRRNAVGLTLVEILVSLVIGVSLCLGMGTILSQSLTQASATQNDFYATCAADNLLEHVKALDYQTLLSLGIGTKQLLVNRTTGGAIGPSIREEPVLLDLQNLVYSDLAKAGKFQGEVTMDIQTGSLPDTALVVIAVSWVDSQRGQGSSSAQKHTVIRTGLVHRYGTRYWG